MSHEFLPQKLWALTKALVTAQQAQVKELQRLYPSGTVIAFKILRNQKTPSVGTVIFHQASMYGGKLRVNHLKVEPGSRGKYRDVRAVDILHVVSKA